MIKKLALFVGVTMLIVVSLALFAGVPLTPTIHFPMIVPLTMVACAAAVFLVTRPSKKRVL